MIKQKREGKYNVVLVTIESLRADFVGYQNQQENNTPFLDHLAKKSFIYTNTIVPGTPTFFHFPSLMTGKLPFAYGYKLGIDASEENKTLAEILRQNGYKTIAVIGDTPQLYGIYNFDRGFDIYLDGHESKSERFMFFINTLWNIRQASPSKIVDVLDYIRAAFKILSGATPPNICAEDLNNKIKRTLRENSTQPFFLWAHYMDAHYPYLGGIDKLDGTFKKILFYKKLITSIKSLKIDNPELINLIKEVYRGGIQNVDTALEKLYKFITTRYPHTIFIITSDHGEAFMEHDMFGHEACSLYNELIKVPLLIHFPSSNKKVIEEVVSTVSLAKTICSILNIKDHTFDGVDLTKSKIDRPINHISKILYNCISPSIRFQIFDAETEIKGFNELLSYTTPQYKYIMERGGDVEELYNLQKDPNEHENIIHKIPKNVLNTLRKKLENLE